MKNRKKWAASAWKSCCLVVCVIVPVLLCLAGCQRNGKPDISDIRILYTSPHKDDDFRALLSQSIGETAKEEGVSLTMQYSGGGVDTQIEQIRAAQKEGYHAVICYPSDPKTALELEEVAGDMPIIFVSNKPVDDYLTADQYMYVGSRERDAGTYQAEYVWERLGKPSSMNVVIMKGEPGHSGTVGRSEAVHDYFTEHGVDVNYVYEDYAFWSAEEAAKKFGIFLNTGQPFDAVFCNNDTMATGVVAVMQKRGMDTAAIPVTGVDATEAGCRSIEDGGMQFTVYQSAKGQGEMSVKTAIALIEEETAEGLEGLDENGLSVWVPFEPVDASNVKQYE